VTGFGHVLVAAVALGGGGGPATAAPATAPVVWVQAGHEGPREPGYRAQTGARGEVAFTVRTADAVAARLRRHGIDARRVPGKVTPLNAPGDVFIAIHYDTPDGSAVVGHAITGAGENWYRGEGSGDARSTPYPDSAPHRAPPSTVNAKVEARSRRLASILRDRYAAVFTRARGARSGGVALLPRTGNRRVMRYVGYYRTRARARVLIECGAGGTDSAFLSRTGLIADTVSAGIVEHLTAEGRLPR
jgi:N-acetylmuramoyl-L-alanine amidase